MCPSICPGLSDCSGSEFETLYKSYESKGLATRTVKARTLWNAILDAQVETGTPYMMYKDACNSKSNQQNLGTIKSSNLCTEIVEFTSPEETAVCNLASVCLPKFVDTNNKRISGSPFGLKNVNENKNPPTFNFQKLHSSIKVMTKNLNRIIDINLYPIKSAGVSNKKHRPIGLGVSGLADVFIRMGVEVSSDEAKGERASERK